MKKMLSKKGKLLFFVLIVVAVMVATLISASAASYPWMFLTNETTDSPHYAGENVALIFSYWPEYHHEIVHINIYDSTGEKVAYVDRQFYNSDGDYNKKYTVNWSTSGYTPGKYKIVVAFEFYSFNRWNEAPSADTYYITLKSESERPVEGWNFIGNEWYYYENGVAVKNNWIQDSNGWCYLGSDGRMATNSWIQDSNGWCYLGSDGRMATNSWIQDSKGWCYLGSNGRMVTNSWAQDSKGWCYLDAEGKWVKNAFVRDSVGWAYITPDGYYYDTKNGWLWYNNGWYYLENGYAVTNQWRLDSVGWCYLSETGLMVTSGFVRDSVGLAYIEEDGYYRERTYWLWYNENWYYLEKGYAVTNTWRLDSKGWCYLGKAGAMYTSTWLKDSVGWCYIDENGYCLANGTYTVEGHKYTFDADGRIQGEPITA